MGFLLREKSLTTESISELPPEWFERLLSPKLFWILICLTFLPCLSNVITITGMI
jgi:hypothetical protein